MKEKTIKALVAEGRTVLHDVGKKVSGEIVELLESEFHRLKALGFVTHLPKPAQVVAPTAPSRASAAPKISVDQKDNPVEVKVAPTVAVQPEGETEAVQGDLVDQGEQSAEVKAD